VYDAAQGASSALQSELILVSLIGNGLTLYMMAILLTWVAPFLELDLRRGWLRVVPRVTEPLIRLMRRALPPMGPLDWSPIAALMVVWVVRLLLVQY